MFHKTLLLINTIGLLLIEALLGSDINITSDAPASLAAGQEVKVTVTVDKGEIIGFAKLQLELADGLTATAIETKGASFTFADQKAKFIWMSLPNSQSFQVSYNLRVEANATGELPITGRFSYIEDNERRTYDIPATSVMIGGAMADDTSPSGTTTSEGSASDLINDSSSDVADISDEPADAIDAATSTMSDATNVVTNAVEETVDNAATSANNVADNATGTVTTTTSSPTNVTAVTGPGDVTGQRSVSVIAGRELLVEVTINKGDLRGFGKLQETLPNGFTAVERDNGDAIFTTQDNIVKFVWLNLPQADKMNVAYVLRAADGTPDGEYEINGEFGYLLNDETQKAVLGGTSFNLKSDAVADNTSTTTNNDVSDNTVQDDPADNTTSSSGSTTTTTTTSDEPDNTHTVTSIPSPETGINYKVQITAAHKEVGKPYFSSRHKYHGDFSIEHHQGWIKYVTGKYDEYRSARDKRVALVSAGHNFPGPFVTAYNDGQRITVQEALMISNQKWVQ